MRTIHTIKYQKRMHSGGAVVMKSWAKFYHFPSASHTKICSKSKRSWKQQPQMCRLQRECEEYPKKMITHGLLNAQEELRQATFLMTVWKHCTNISSEVTAQVKKSASLA